MELVVVGYRSRPQVAALLAGLPPDLPVAVVDNSDGSDGLEDLLRGRPHARYLSGGGIGFGQAATAGVRSSSADVVVFVNPDVRPTAADIATLVSDVVDDPRCAASAAVLVEGEDRMQIGIGGWEPTVRRAAVHALGLHKIWRSAGLFARPRRGEQLTVDWVSGACMAVRRTTFLELGGFDPDFFVYNEDMAFGRACRERGLRQRLRTDVVVPGTSGGSGAPSLEMMRLRGASMTRYLRKYSSTPTAAATAALLAVGYSVRALAVRLRGDVARSREHTCYVRGLLTGRATVGGRVVTEGRPRPHEPAAA